MSCLKSGSVFQQEIEKYSKWLTHKASGGTCTSRKQKQFWPSPVITCTRINSKIGTVKNRPKSNSVRHRYTSVRPAS